MNFEINLKEIEIDKVLTFDCETVFARKKQKKMIIKKKEN